MTNRAMIVLLLAALAAAAAISEFVRGGAMQGTVSSRLVWTGFLYGLPALLAGLVVVGQRWALMVCVMYGTIGLALDIATLVQESTGPAPQRGTLVLIGASGLMNFLLIMLAGWNFIHGSPASRPPASPPPNPPHLSTS